jgi:hypothetical protein
MLNYTSLEQIKQQQQFNEYLADLDGWDKIKHFGAQFCMIIGVIVYSYLTSWKAEGGFAAIGMLASAVASGLIGYAILRIIQFFYELIFE